MNELPDGILKGRDAKEYRLQVACIDYITGQRRVKNKPYQITRPFPQLWIRDEVDGKEYKRFTHCYAGRDANEGHYLKLMGVRPGIYDILLWWEAGFHWIDLKCGTGLSDPQKQFNRDMTRIGIPHATASSVAEFRDLLIGWGLTCLNPHVHEPAVSLEQKQLAYLEMMKPL